MALHVGLVPVQHNEHRPTLDWVQKTKPIHRPSPLPTCTAIDDTESPSTAIRITPTPTEPPSLTLLYDPPTPEECVAIASGEDLDGQDTLTIRNFQVFLESVFDSEINSEINNELVALELQENMQQLLMPEIAGCSDETSNRRKMRGSTNDNRKLGAGAFVVANGLVSVRLADTSCVVVSLETPCLHAIASIDLYLKGPQRILDLINIFISVFGLGREDSLVQKLNLLQPYKEIIITSIDSGDPTPAPSSAPTERPSVSPTLTPTKISSENPTRAPVTFPTNEEPTKDPTKEPTRAPTPAPSPPPTPGPTLPLTPPPTPGPTPPPTPDPTPDPTRDPTQDPTQAPTPDPTSVPEGRCGPLFDGRVCQCDFQNYCNENNGWCGDTTSHRDAQASTTYDCPSEPDCYYHGDGLLYSEIRSRVDSSLCLGYSITNVGEDLTMAPCQSIQEQFWAYDYSTNEIKNLWSLNDESNTFGQMCIDPEGPSTSNGTPLQL
jgi:hypothetical protein